ncbi:MAG TPA: tRNA preQ1(34) S-adenosylmethionine ribosyltransferase-isomerase QueA [Burkholderiales bacterium]|nr:tRNA preQ1(34) S-adenosylmethionine ribosyltransferase-isomerase QueA [Burkholderiales bacterium]
MKLQEFDYHLPEELIAQHPAPKRTASRLLVMDDHGLLSDRVFNEFPDFLNPDDLLVFNDTKVIRARLFGRKESGGKVEAMVERMLDEHRVLALIRASHAPKPGAVLDFGGEKAEVLERCGDFHMLRFDSAASLVLERMGRIPLPPYIVHAATESDEARYQTVYAKHPGAVAAPTAGLHFDQEILERIKGKGVHAAYVTLHVGAGTFQPVRVENIEEHTMHSEVYSVPEETLDAIERARERGGKVIAVGTTALRALESAACSGKGTGETSIYITPGFEFRTVDRLLTNFHLPKSTLLMLVSAFSGMDEMRRAYRHAVSEKYRFFSYGDAMLIERMKK